MQHAAAAASRPAAPNLCISDYLASLLAIQTRDNGDAMRSHWHTQGQHGHYWHPGRLMD